MKNVIVTIKKNTKSRIKFILWCWIQCLQSYCKKYWFLELGSCSNSCIDSNSIWRLINWNRVCKTDFSPLDLRDLYATRLLSTKIQSKTLAFDPGWEMVATNAKSSNRKPLGFVYHAPKTFLLVNRILNFFSVFSWNMFGSLMTRMQSFNCHQQTSNPRNCVTSSEILFRSFLC